MTKIRQSISAEELTGRAAVITGGAKGIGLAAVKRLASLGMKLCVADSDEPSLEKVGIGIPPLSRTVRL
jgi:NAD(P)-dependent dehydrogenase (short-subunit alcohol dehydrogenase family)